MLKTLNIPLDISDYNKIKEVKGDTTWRDFLLKCCGDKDNKTDRSN